MCPFSLVILGNGENLLLVLVVKSVCTRKLIDIAVDTQGIELHSASLLIQEQPYFQGLARFGISTLVIMDCVAGVSYTYRKVYLLLGTHLANQFIQPGSDLMQWRVLTGAQKANQHPAVLAYKRIEVF